MNRVFGTLMVTVCGGVLVIPGVLGCGGGDGLRRVVVRGKVERQGAPLKAGSISFLPVEGLKAPSAIADVVNGEYRFTARDGPVAGKYQVVVMLPPEGKRGMLGAAAGKPVPAGAGTAGATSLPGRWEFRVEVPTQGPLVYDVRLP